MCSASRGSLEPEASSNRSVYPRIGCLFAIEGVEGADLTTGYLTNFAGQFQKQKIQRQIREYVGPSERLLQRNRTHVRFWTRRHRASSNVRADVGRRFISVLTSADRNTEE